jgi:diaminohydroxyphosphoribosylaminopyrimidine deaminase/5-amino-6-(5-phosphoribosylamino)uracil reductase
VIAVEDPNPLVAGRGLAHLREHGIDVVVGPLADAAERLNLPFFTRMRRRRPFVTMKVALSRDRRVAAAAGVRTPLTGSEANRLIHRERAEVDAIAVGSGTVLADDPLLTARGAFRRRPLTRIIFDRSLRTPVDARLLTTLDAGPILVVTLEPAGAEARRRSRALEERGAELAVLPRSTPEAALIPAALARLAERGVSSLVVEGGPTLHRAVWRAGVVDRVQVFNTPAVLGGHGVLWLNEIEFSPADLRDVRTVRLGETVLVEGYVHRTD